VRNRSQRVRMSWRGGSSACATPSSTADRLEQLACDGRYDLHALLELVDQGCPPRLAPRILAPHDEEDTSR
jgi:hypothetical protein